MYTGPFIVTKKVAKNLYQIVDLGGQVTKIPVHVSLMKPYYLRGGMLEAKGIVMDLVLPYQSSSSHIRI
jgi:phage baseplate assembly protein gpV